VPRIAQGIGIDARQGGGQAARPNGVAGLDQSPIESHSVPILNGRTEGLTLQVHRSFGASAIDYGQNNIIIKKNNNLTSVFNCN
jgi:hypothetical protein